MRIPFKHGAVDVPETTVLCAREELAAAQVKFDAFAERLFSLLPEDHPWRLKLFDKGKLDADIAPILAHLADLSREMVDFVRFVYQAHDIGRVVEALKKLGKPLPFTTDFSGENNHAVISVALLRESDVLGCFNDRAQKVIEYAIVNHFGGSTPELAPDPDEDAVIAYFTACLLRDMDKYGTFRDRTRSYLSDPAGQIALFDWLGNESGLIEPANYLKDFASFGSLRRAVPCSYEGYMLYFLHWLFDVNLGAVIQAIIDTGAIAELLAYFRKQLPIEQSELIESTLKVYLLKTWKIDLRV